MDKTLLPYVAIGVGAFMAGVILSSKFRVGEMMSKVPLIGGLFA